MLKTWSSVFWCSALLIALFQSFVLLKPSQVVTSFSCCLLILILLRDSQIWGQRKWPVSLQPLTSPLPDPPAHKLLDSHAWPHLPFLASSLFPPFLPILCLSPALIFVCILLLNESMFLPSITFNHVTGIMPRVLPVNHWGWSKTPCRVRKNKQMQNSSCERSGWNTHINHTQMLCGIHAKLNMYAHRKH